MSPSDVARWPVTVFWTNEARMAAPRFRTLDVALSYASGAGRAASVWGAGRLLATYDPSRVGEEERRYV